MQKTKNERARMKTFIIIAFAISMSACNKGGKWVLHFDRSERVITDCMYISADSVASLWIAMKCQNSIMADIKLCTQGRMLQAFSSKDDCVAASNTSVKIKGKYTLESDPIENLFNKGH